MNKSIHYSEGISDAIRDRDYDSFGGANRPTTYRRVVDSSAHKIAQLQELSLKGKCLDSLGILTNNRGIFLTLNDGTLLYRE